MARILGCSGGSVKWVPGTSYSGGRGTTSPGRALAVPLPAHLLQPCDPAARTGVCSQYRWPVWNYVAPFGHPICRSRHVTALAPRSRAQRSRRESAAVCVRAGGTRPACAGSVRCRRRAALVALSPDGCKFGDAGGLSGQFHLHFRLHFPRCRQDHLSQLVGIAARRDRHIHDQLSLGCGKGYVPVFPCTAIVITPRVMADVIARLQVSS